MSSDCGMAEPRLVLVSWAVGAGVLEVGYVVISGQSRDTAVETKDATKSQYRF